MTPPPSKKVKKNDTYPMICPNRKKLKIDLTSLDSTIEILVGKEVKSFIFHKNLLRSATPYFDEALKWSHQEGPGQIVRLSEENSDIVRRFQLWLYSGSFLVDKEGAQSLDWSLAIRLYIFAENRVIPLLQDHVIDALAIKTKDITTITLPSWTLIDLAHRHTKKGSPLSRLLTVLVVECLNTHFDKRILEQSSKAMLVDLFIAQLHYKDAGPQWPRAQDELCMFHVHPSAAPELGQDGESGEVTNGSCGR